MINIEEFRDKSNDMLMEVTDYIQDADISYREKQKRTVELSITLFMTSIRMNSEKEAKNRFCTSHFTINTCCRRND